MDIVTLFVSGFFLFFIIKSIVIVKFVELAYSVFTNKWVLISLVIGILAFMIIPEIVTPYYEILWTYVINGIKSVFTLIWDFFKVLLDLA